MTSQTAPPVLAPVLAILCTSAAALQQLSDAMDYVDSGHFVVMVASKKKKHCLKKHFFYSVTVRVNQCVAVSVVQNSGRREPVQLWPAAWRLVGKGCSSCRRGPFVIPVSVRAHTCVLCVLFVHLCVSFCDQDTID